MPNIVFRFPGGRYHATPWGNHVNEGLVEWPPSPWRIIRALLATGFSKLGWREAPPAARDLVDGLASVLPTYRLPPATAAHTRHWMPTDSPKPEERTRVLDAFARVGRDAQLAVVWPATLSAAADALLRELVPKISYLGRAESVVVARLADDTDLPDGLISSADVGQQAGMDPIALLAPIRDSEYRTWRSTAVPPATAAKKGKASKAAPVPPDILAAVLVDTAFLQEHGWTQPPGSRRVHYYRPAEALATAPPRVVSRTRVVADADTALLSLASDTRNREVLPLLSRALPQAELLHAGLASKLRDAVCPELTGRGPDGARLEGHRHAFVVPLSLDQAAHLDHFLIHAPMGLGPDAQRALRAIRSTYTKGGENPLYVTLAGLGRLESFTHIGQVALPELGEALEWTSRTPFIPPRHIKRTRNTLEDQVQAELAGRGLPRATRVDVLDRTTLLQRGFHRFVRVRRDPRRKPAAPCFFALRIVFERPARGPIALGYASHFGMGLMVPCT